jgi:hypothetical protein
LFFNNKGLATDRKYNLKEEIIRSSKNADKLSNYDNINFDSQSEFERLNDKVNKFEFLFLHFMPNKW